MFCTRRRPHPQWRGVREGSVVGMSLEGSLQKDGTAWEGHVRWREREKGPLCAAAGRRGRPRAACRRPMGCRAGAGRPGARLGGGQGQRERSRPAAPAAASLGSGAAPAALAGAPAQTLETQSRGAGGQGTKGWAAAPRGPGARRGRLRHRHAPLSFLGATPNTRRAGRSETWWGAGWRLGDHAPCCWGELIGSLPGREG